MGKGKLTKSRIEQATIKVVGIKGPKHATVRDIAREAGITEGLLYKYFENKCDLISSVWRECMTSMLQAKKETAKTYESYDQFILNWIRISFEAYDSNPDSFSLLFLQHIPELDEESTRLKKQQGKLFISVMNRAKSEDKLKWKDTVLATHLFANHFLSIPKLIRAKVISGPASDYTEMIARSSQQMLLKQT